jgi:arylsulfatase A-like enzyme
MILPHHPTVGEYGQLHSSSFPNPVLQAGTLFLGPQTRMLQEQFAAGDNSLFIANTKAYLSVSRGFTINIHQPGLSDDEVVDQGIELLRRYDIRYARIHLQTPGNEGRYLSYTSPDKPYYRNIWGDQSPYVRSVQEADWLLGKLVTYLKDSGKWHSTLLVVTSDHGQSEKGWHPIIETDSVQTPLLFIGPGIGVGRTLPYFEHTDLSPTIAGLMGIPPPNTDGGAGRDLSDVLTGRDSVAFVHPRYIETLNRQLNEYNALRARIMIAGEKESYYSSLISYLENELLTPEPFYHQDRFLEWYRAGSTEHLIEVNQRVLAQMRQELSQLDKP